MQKRSPRNLAKNLSAALFPSASQDSFAPSVPASRIASLFYITISDDGRGALPSLGDILEGEKAVLHCNAPTKNSSSNGLDCLQTDGLLGY